MTEIVSRHAARENRQFVVKESVCVCVCLKACLFDIVDRVRFLVLFLFLLFFLFGRVDLLFAYVLVILIAGLCAMCVVCVRAGLYVCVYYVCAVTSATLQRSAPIASPPRRHCVYVYVHV